MKKIKIAFVADMLLENADGAIRTMYQIIGRIPKDRFEFLFICGVPPKGKFDFEILTVPTTPLPININYSMALPFLAERKMTEKLKAFQPDVIHISTPSPLGHFALNHGNKYKIPVSAIYHTHFLSYVDYYLKKVPLMIPPIKEKIIQFTVTFYNRCQLTLVPTNNVIDELAAYGLKRNKMKLWQRGIDKQLFHPSKKDKSYIQNIVKNDRPNLLFASRLVWEKNLDTLIKIYQQAKQENLDYNFIIVGDGRAKTEMEQAMPNAFFLGHQNHEALATLYASSDVFLFPSNTESYGNVVIEAMASGLPCVIADGGGSGSLVQNGYNGIACPTHDPQAYLDGIQSILSQANLRESFIENGFQYIQHLDWDQLTTLYFRELTSLTKIEEPLPLFI